MSLLVWSFPSWGGRLDGTTYIGGDLPSLLAQNISLGYQEMNQLKSLVSRAGSIPCNTSVYLSPTATSSDFHQAFLLLPCKGIKNNILDRLAVEGKVSNPGHHCGLCL